MKRFLIVAALVSLPITSALAEPDLYGKANLSFELVDETDNSGTALESNSSRLGFKGSERLNDEIELVYQLEYGVEFDDGNTFSQRNIFVGVQNETWGRMIAGHIDTPLKRAQGKVDVFNDLRADIKRTTTIHDNRKSNSVMYTTPKSFGPFAAEVAYISSEEDDRTDGKSLAVSYNENNLYAAVAVDLDVEEEDSEVARFVGAYNWDNWQVGALVETSDAPLTGRNNGWVVSGLYQLDDQWNLKAQVGQSDIIEEDGYTASLGADYKISRSARAFTFYTLFDADSRDAHHYLGAGIELKF